MYAARKAAARKIQDAVRSWLARRRFLAMRHAATVLQASDTLMLVKIIQNEDFNLSLALEMEVLFIRAVLQGLE